MIKQKDLKYKNNSYYYEDKLFTGQAIDNYGSKFWYKEGKLHRETGPATHYYSGYKEWYYNGEFINCKNNEEFLKIIKLFLFK